MWKTLIGCLLWVGLFAVVGGLNFWMGITGFIPAYFVGCFCLFCAGHEVLRTWKSLQTLKS